jgi:arylsulfatase A-like enzyme
MNSPAEGGMRVPFLARWPGRIPAATECTEVATMMDLLPTFAALARAAAPGPEVIDGRNIWPLLAAEAGARSPQEAFYFYHYDQLQAVRSGPWKLFPGLKRQRMGSGAPPKSGNPEPRLFHVVDDPGESRDVASAHPEIVARLEGFAERARREVGDLERHGTRERPAGWVFDPQVPRMPATP